MKHSSGLFFMMAEGAVRSRFESGDTADESAKAFVFHRGGRVDLLAMGALDKDHQAKVMRNALAHPDTVGLGFVCEAWYAMVPNEEAIPSGGLADRPGSKEAILMTYYPVEGASEMKMIPIEAGRTLGATTEARSAGRESVGRFSDGELQPRRH